MGRLKRRGCTVAKKRGRKSILAFAAKIESLVPRLAPVVVSAYREGFRRGVAYVAQTIQSPYRGMAPPVDTAAMLQSVRARDIPRGASLGVEAPHAVFMERGTRPHWAPLGPLLTWVVRRLGVPEDEAEGIARAVQAKIAEEGTAPRFFFRRAMAQIRRKVLPTELRRALGNVPA